MSFASLEFGLFFVTVFALYCALPHRGQNWMLLAASYVFYAAWDWRFLFLLLTSTVVDFVVGRALSRSNDERRRRRLAGLSLVSNLGILGYFKYAGFFSEGLRNLGALVGFEVSPFVLDIILPAGISFYTFQTLSYTLDIYRRRLEPTHNFCDFALFVAFFPQLVAGPIERARRLLPQIAARREVTIERINAGAWLILWGLYKKVVIADNLAAVVDAVYRPGSNATSGELIIATYAFAWQIYCDFSGYTDIARGAARMMGFDLMLNFRVPYAAANPAEFWRRWHISLSQWLRDYLYISLGGNRLSAWLTYRNLFLTMVIGGLWHGAAWPFVLWGAYHGVLLIGHRLLQPAAEKEELASGRHGGVRRFLSCVVLFQFVSLGWLFFRAQSLDHVGELLGVLFGPFEVGLAPDWIFPLCFLLAPLIVIQVAQERTNSLDVVLRLPLPVRALVYASLALGILIIGEQIGQPFIYFQF